LRGAGRRQRQRQSLLAHAQRPRLEIEMFHELVPGAAERELAAGRPRPLHRPVRTHSPDREPGAAGHEPLLDPGARGAAKHAVNALP
jgi:hypothetical protein